LFRGEHDLIQLSSGAGESKTLIGLQAASIKIDPRQIVQVDQIGAADNAGDRQFQGCDGGAGRCLTFGDMSAPFNALVGSTSARAVR
jgi:hypothetical protein